MKDRPLMNKNDPLIIVALLSAALAIMLLMLHFEDFDYKAEIYKDGELVKTVPLEKTKDMTFMVDGLDMEFMVQEGRLSVIHSNCRDKVCVRTGTIRNSYRTIICLPNRVIVKIASKSEETDIDLTV